MMRAPGDRRSRVRFEVFGAFWGTFDAGDAVRVHNITPYGALIEAHQPLAVESVQSVCLMLDGQPAMADARVRHLKAAPPGDRYLVGVEFVAAPTAFLEACWAHHPSNHFLDQLDLARVICGVAGVSPRLARVCACAAGDCGWWFVDDTKVTPPS